MSYKSDYGKCSKCSENELQNDVIGFCLKNYKCTGGLFFPIQSLVASKDYFNYAQFGRRAHEAQAWEYLLKLAPARAMAC